MSETSTSRKSDPQEPSMEDILASIRRILAEDGGAISQGAEAVDADIAAVPAPETETEPELASEELVMDRTDDPLLADRDAEPSTRPPAGAATEKDVFLLSPEMREGGHALVSPQAAENSTDVLSQLARAILDRRDMTVAARDVTLESMVREMLRPLLPEWPARNLPYLIARRAKTQ